MHLSRKSRLILRDVIGSHRIFEIADLFCRFFGVSFPDAYSSKLGIGNFGSLSTTGEENFVIHFLKPLLKDFEYLTFFDVGSHKGSYSLLLRKNFPKASIYAFEPNLFLQDQLQESLKDTGVQTFFFGFGNETGEFLATGFQGDPSLETVTLYSDSLCLVAPDKFQETIEFKFEIKKIDDFVKSEEINEIHFLKIDTEGHELSVLQGAKNLIENHNIKIIQFEFNLNHVYSRVFMRDFYSLLKNYKFFRITPYGLLYLGQYHPHSHEVFRFQNIVAFENSIDLTHIVKYK